CLSAEEPSIAGALGVGFDIFNNTEIDNNHVSVHFNGALISAVSATPVTDLGSGQWIHARIVVRPGGGQSNVSVFLTPTGGTETTLINNLAVPGLAPYESRVYFSARTGGQTAGHDIANVNVTYSGDPAVVGSWSGIAGLPVVPIHSIMMPSQKILFWDRAAANTDINPRLFNTLDGTVTSTANPAVELFCSGHSLDPQGRVLVFGGHDGSDGFGLHTAFAYESPANIFRALPNMNAGRWYPTNTALGNGDTLVVSGSSTPGTVNQLPQVFQDKTQTWRSLTSANNNFPLYPMMIAAPDGRVFNAGPNADTKFLTVTGTGAWSAPITNIYGSHDYGSAVLYDEGKLVVIGGGFTTNGVEAIDLKAATPVWTARTSMAFPRRQSNAIILADGNILVTGGSKTPVFNSAAGAIFASEIYDPLANTWSMGAAMAVARLYHSETLLYADGRVVSRGGGHPAADAGGTDNFNQEIYSPPYLFKGARPSVTAAPTSAANGQTIFIQTPDGAGITKAHLIRLNAVTHSFDQNQRIIRLAFTQVTGGLNAVIPASSNVVLPGHYWLFIVNGSGVPSIGRVISVQRPYQQSTASDGIVSIEVERFHDSVTQGGHTWNRTTTSGNSGSGALAAQPNNGANVNTGFAAGAPRVDFWVNFTKTGTHYVWLRGLGATADDDSAHVGLDGVENTTADRITSFGSGLNWTKATMDGPVATINVPSAGLRRVSVWMREDGLVLDKLLLTTNSAFLPTGAGPAESAPY
ncbi:MAG TPA: galactose oxidase-like domain-containing protein, partial [Polyangia bacterium]|nr:galactose oxidase-like domain-containing protein [Polyangia bacterium]